jgi:hypothetical protein
MKTLRREVIIRDSDLEPLLKKTIKKKLYDRFDLEPMTYKGIQQEYIITVLKNPNERVPKFNPLPNLYEDMLYRERNLYDKRYLGWIFTMDYPDGQIWIQSSIRVKREQLHRVTFERDYG